MIDKLTKKKQWGEVTKTYSKSQLVLIHFFFISELELNIKEKKRETNKVEKNVVNLISGITQIWHD